MGDLDGIFANGRTYGSLAAKDTMITLLCDMCICRPQISAMQKVNNKISVEISKAAIACQRENLLLSVYPIQHPYIWFVVVCRVRLALVQW